MKPRSVHSKGLPGLKGEARKDSWIRNLGAPKESFGLGYRERSQGGAMNKKKRMK